MSRLQPDIYQRCFLKALFLNTVRGVVLRWLTTYDIAHLDALEPKGISSYMNLISQRAKMEGFVM
jgi:hypothetical protein